MNASLKPTMSFEVHFSVSENEARALARLGEFNPTSTADLLGKHLTGDFDPNGKYRDGLEIFLHSVSGALSRSLNCMNNARAAAKPERNPELQST